MIIQRYLFREVLQTFVAVLSILLLIFVSHRFVRYLAEAAAGRIGSEAILQLLVLKLLASLVILIPLAVYIAILLGFGRMYKDSEIVAMTAGGIGIIRLARSMVWFSLGFAMLVMVLSLYVSPRVAVLMADLRDQAVQQSEISGVYPGRFKEFSDGNQVLYVESIVPDERRMHNVFVQIREGDTVDILVSDSGYQSVDEKSGDRFVVLVDGYRYQGSPGSADYIITQFSKHTSLIERNHRGEKYRKLETLPTTELLGSDDPVYLAELQRRISFPVSVLVLGLLAVPLARTSPHRGKYANLFSAILIYFIYINSGGIAQKLVEDGDLPPTIGVWPIHGALVLFGVALLFSQSSKRWRLVATLRRWVLRR